MNRENTILAQKQQINFESILSEVCKILHNKQHQYSLLRLREFDERLEYLERELDIFLSTVR